MLFPVFARARESARKVQCLSNVKNLALAVQMYLADYQKFYPCEHNPAADEYFRTAPGGGNSGDCCNRKPQANPYLRQAVILDEYVKNRDVFRCPSSKIYAGPGWIVPDYGKGYLNYLKETEGLWGRKQSDPCSCGPCGVAYPPGWGGTVTDSMKQRLVGGADSGAPEMTIGFTQLQDVKEAQILDPSWLIVAADMQRGIYILGPDSILYNLCRTTTCGDESCCSADWQNCPDTQNCGLDYDARDEWFGDAGCRARYTPHMGGANIAFADGHASWWPAEQLLANTPYCGDDGIVREGRKIRGLCPVGVN
jgi:prepilin-type processing-associated H-X9-DG protein